MTEPDFELMTPDEVAVAARAAFAAAERYALRAVDMTREDGGALHAMALSLDSIAYGLKITTPETPAA